MSTAPNFAGIAGHFVPLRLPRAFLVLNAPETWADVVRRVVEDAGGPVSLQELYRAVANHPKARDRKHYPAKIRQVLQKGPFRRVRNGVWQGAAA